MRDRLSSPPIHSTTPSRCTATRIFSADTRAMVAHLARSGKFAVETATMSRRAQRVRVCFHDNCFDGAASAALFTRFYRERVDGGAEVLYRGMAHAPGDVFPPGTFDGDENAVVDFRYSSDPA